ncbi:MAG: alanyl-tRNA editing protein [Ruminococcaceae bacterium]|nr:alanyl-tRNA editing protein [Oscillospiraceae bacterium]
MCYTVKTQRLFDLDSYRFDFYATVLSCVANGDGNFTVVLDKTAFFPEGGGQRCDLGTLGNADVLDVQEKLGVICHTVSTLLDEGTEVYGRIDADTRLVRMQNHSGEHIVSGLVHKHFGYNNVGFHLSDGEMYFDFDGYLDRTALNMIEDEANAIVWQDLPVTAYYPSSDKLAELEYRSKLDLTENVRIVQIGDCDRCACCAPHVRSTGEIGIIKLLDAIKYKGGTRIHALCGRWALEDYRVRYTAIVAMSARMSVKQHEVSVGFDHLLSELDSKRAEIATLNQKIIDLSINSIKEGAKNLCFFFDELDTLNMRKLLNRAVLKCTGICGIFGGNDTDGYQFVIGRGSSDIDLKAYASEISSALLASGGGSSEMQQGKARADESTIRKYFEQF